MRGSIVGLLVAACVAVSCSSAPAPGQISSGQAVALALKEGARQGGTFLAVETMTLDAGHHYGMPQDVLHDHFLRLKPDMMVWAVVVSGQFPNHGAGRTLLLLDAETGEVVGGCMPYNVSDLPYCGPHGGRTPPL